MLALNFDETKRDAVATAIEPLGSRINSKLGFLGAPYPPAVGGRTVTAFAQTAI